MISDYLKEALPPSPPHTQLHQHLHPQITPLWCDAYNSLTPPPLHPTLTWTLTFSKTLPKRAKATSTGHVTLLLLYMSIIVPPHDPQETPSQSRKNITRMCMMWLMTLYHKSPCQPFTYRWLPFIILLAWPHKVEHSWSRELVRPFLVQRVR